MKTLLFFILTLAAPCLATQAMTVKKWQALSSEEQEDLISGGDLKSYPNIKYVKLDGEDVLEQLTSAPLKKFAAKMKTFMEQNSNLEVEDEHCLVGGAQVRWLTLVHLEDQVLGGSIGFVQKGCDLEENNWQHFSTEEEARRAGCDVDADVSWQAHHGTFTLDAKPLNYDEYMEWSGY